jgi:mono/diheme cytochrome c family protein
VVRRSRPDANLVTQCHEAATERTTNAPVRGRKSRMEDNSRRSQMAPSLRSSLMFVALTTVVSGPSQAPAQTIGDVANGRAIAVRECGDCHAVLPNTASRNPDTPSFTRVANTPGMTSIALNAFFQTAHRTMPQISLPIADTHDLVAYILSLKSP